MPLTDQQISTLLTSIESKNEAAIASAVFNTEGVLREVISLIASHPEKLTSIGGPIKAIENVKDSNVFNVEVSVDPSYGSQSVEAMPVAEDNSSIAGSTQEISHNPEEMSTAEGNKILQTLDDDCLEFTTVTTSLGETVQVHIKSVDKQKSRNNSNKNATHPCPHCDLTFVRMFELQRHITVRHTKDKLFECGECGKRFALKLYLKNHIRSQHQPNEMKPYACPHCDYRCIVQSMLNRHMERHINEKNFKCEVCDQYFYTLKHLRHHMFKHQEKNLQCAYCDYKTANPYSLNSHTKTHTSTEVFHCDQCQFTTNVKAELNKHNLDSHCEVEYACECCSQTFKKIANLKRHMYVHQEKNLQCTKEGCEWRTADPYELKRHEREHAEGKKHVCDVCGFAFHRSFDLKKHQKVHTKVHECKTCHATFADSHLLACHRRRRHRKNKDSKATIVYKDRMDTSTESPANHSPPADDTLIEQTVETTENHTIILNSNEDQILLEPNTQFIVSDSDQQLLEVTSVIITQGDEANLGQTEAPS